MWLRGHDNTVENRSAERFGQAMRVLSRRPAEETAGDADYSRDDSDDLRDEPRRQYQPDYAPVEMQTPARPTAPMRESRRQDSQPSAPKRRTSLAVRRARTLAVLAGLTVLLGLLAVVGVLPIWAPLPFVALLAAFVVHLRNQAKRAEQRRRRLGSPGTASSAAAPSETSPAKAKSRASNRSAAEFVPGPSRAMVVETKRAGRSSDVTTEEVPSEWVSAPAAATEDDDEAWRPNPLPVPTYVTAPKAVRPIRVIDLTSPGAWTSGRLLDDEAVADEDLLAADLAADELDGLLEHEAKGPIDPESGRRAVGD